MIFSTFWWYLEVGLIISSAILVSSEIDQMVRTMRVNAGAPSLSFDGSTPPWLVAALDSAFMFLTTCGLVVKCLTEGMWRTVRQPWNILDILCLGSSVMRLLFVGWRRTLLSFASLRVFMLLPRFKELRLLFESILRAMPNVLVTMCSLIVIWLMFAILGVSMFGGGTSQCARLNDTKGLPGCGGGENDPIVCRYATTPLPPPVGVVPGVTNSSACGCAWVDGVNQCAPIEIDGELVAWVPSFPSFDTTAQALLALLQISTLDGWAHVMYFSMDVTAVDTQPARESQYLLPIVYYLLFVIFGVLFATNVFVGVVIDEFNRIRRLYDGSATLTEEQVKWVNTQRLILRLQPEKQVAFEPGPDQPRRQWCFRLVHDEEALGRPTNAPESAVYRGKAFDRAVRTAICANVVNLMLWTNPIAPGTLYVYDSLNYLFVLLYAAEAATKITALSFREYIRSAWNAFDFFLVAFSLCSSIATFTATALLGMDLTGTLGISMRWLRCVRALRVMRLTTLSPSLTKMLRTMLFAAPSIGNITFGIFIFTYAYAQFGMAFLGTLMYDYEGAGFSRHANFEVATRAVSTLVRMATADSWSAILADAVHNPHVPGVEPPAPGTVYCFFIFYMAFMGWVLVSIFVAIILEYFNDSNAEEGVSIKFDDIESFQRKWLEFDPKSSSYIRTVDLGLLLYACKPPLVGVRLEAEGFFVGAQQQLVRPNLHQLEQMLVELDVPEHDGSIHFLELLLALLQRVTGVINEELMMNRLLSQHHSYIPSIKRMPAITGSTADPYIKDEVMAHLRRGLEATGLLDDLDGGHERSGGSSFGARASDDPQGSPPGSGKWGQAKAKVDMARSFTRKRDPNDKQRVCDERDKMNRRASLARVATSNKLERDIMSFTQKQADDRRAARTPSCVGTLVDSFVKRRPSGDGGSFGSNMGGSFGSNKDDPLAC